MKRRSTKKKILEANAIHLYDTTGKLRIMLDAGDESGFASINLFSTTGKSIQISTQPDGSVAISLMGKRCTAHATLALSHDEAAGLHLSDREGKLGTTIGAVFDETHRLMLFDGGQPYWRTPKPKKRRATKRTGTKSRDDA